MNIDRFIAFLTSFKPIALLLYILSVKHYQVGTPIILLKDNRIFFLSCTLAGWDLNFKKNILSVS